MRSDALDTFRAHFFSADSFTRPLVAFWVPEHAFKVDLRLGGRNEPKSKLNFRIGNSNELIGRNRPVVNIDLNNRELSEAVGIKRVVEYGTHYLFRIVLGKWDS